MTWQQFYNDLADGKPINGSRMMQLPRLEAKEPIDPECDYDECANTVLTEVIAHGAKLAAKASGDYDDMAWLEPALDFAIEIDAAIAAGKKPSYELRCYAWQTGVQADFAAGLREACEALC